MGITAQPGSVKRTERATNLEVRPVWFLAISESDDRGLVFPAEIEGEYYTGGLFIVEGGRWGEPDWEYEFLARRGGQIVSLRLSQSEFLNAPQRYARSDRVLVADVPDLGRFMFVATPLNQHRTRAIKYIGSSAVLRDHGELWVLSPANPELHEQAVRQDDFYFLGAVGA